MQLTHLSLALGPALLHMAAAAPADEPLGNQNTNEAYGLLTKGQGYNTFLEKGRIVDAVIWPKNKKRADSDAPENTQNEIGFDFVPPTTGLDDFAGIDAAEYFEAPKPEEVEARIAEELKKLKDEKRRKKEEKKKLLASNSLQSRAEDPSCPGTVHKETKFIEDYKTYLKTLGIGGGATISGWGQSASVSGNYLDQAKFNKNSLTYIAVINVERQNTEPGGFQFNTARYKAGRFAKDFGDRWIHGFKTGGRMVARVTFTATDDTKSTDLKANAKTALSFWGVKGDLTLDVKKGMEEVNKHTTVEVSLFYQGELGAIMNKEKSPKDISFGSAESVLSQVKTWADKFEDYVCKQNFAYGPLLDEYDVVPGFSDLDDVEVPDYDFVSLYSIEILSLMVKIEEQKNILVASKEIDDTKKSEITRDALQMIGEGKKWVKSAGQDPEKAAPEAAKVMTSLGTNFINKYKADVTLALKVNDPAGFAKCKKLANQKTVECVRTHGKSQEGQDVFEFCAKVGKDTMDQCRAGTL